MKLATSGRSAAYCIGIGIAVLALLAAVVLAVPTGAQADMNVDGLEVSGANETISGNVTDVVLTATLDYTHDVPDAERRIVKLKAGPSADDLSLIEYDQTRDPSGTGSGTVTLSGSVIDATSLQPSDFQPSLAGNTSQEIVVEAVIEVPRAGGDAVTHTVRDTATVTVEDSTDLTVDVGGSGSVSVSAA